MYHQSYGLCPYNLTIIFSLETIVLPLDYHNQTLYYKLHKGIHLNVIFPYWRSQKMIIKRINLHASIQIILCYCSVIFFNRILGSIQFLPHNFNLMHILITYFDTCICIRNHNIDINHLQIISRIHSIVVPNNKSRKCHKKYTRKCHKLLRPYVIPLIQHSLNKYFYVPDILLL